MKPFFFRRIVYCFLLVAALLSVGSSLRAYPVKITINATFVSIPGQSDPLGLGTANPPITATITTTLNSSLPQASYPATVFVTLPGLLNDAMQSGSLSINANGQISASFSGAQGSFNALLALPITFPSPTPTSFGTASFSSPASSVMYNLLGSSGTVGISGTVSALGLTASPASITESYTVSGATPAPAAINVTSNDPSNASQAFTVAIANAATPFLTLSASSGTTPASITASFSTTVGPGTYTADIQISSGTGAPLSIPVTYTVTSTGGGGGGGGQTLQISPSALTFQFFAPVTASQTQTLSINSSKTASYTASIATGGNFLTLGSSGGTTPGTISVIGNPGSLAAGAYSGSIVVSSPSTPPVTIPVTLINGASGGGGGPATLSVVPTLLRFNYVVGQPVPAPQTLTILNPTPVAFTVSNVLFYLPVTPSSGSTPSTVTVSLNPAGLAPGSYTDTLAIRAATGGVTNVPVIVNVAATAAPALTATPATLAFTYSPTASGPLSATLAITGNTALTYSAATTAPWLTLTGATGTTPGTVTVTASPAGLAVGTYNGTVTLSAPGAATLTIPVTLNVPTAAPSLSANPGAVAFAYQLGGTKPASQTFTIAGSSTGLSVTAVAGSWLSVMQSTDLTTTTLSVNPANLTAGTYNGAIKVETSSSTPIYVPVTLTVSSGPAIGVSSTELTFSSGGAATKLTASVAVSTTDGSALAVAVDSPWLTVSSASVTAGTFTVTATPGTLANGSYQGNVILTGSGSPAIVIHIPVTLNLGFTAKPALNAVTNGISFQNTIASPGLIVALWGQGLGPATPSPLVLNAGNTLANSVGGTQVTVDGIPSPILFSSATQVNAMMPFSLVGQTSADVQLFYQGVPSAVVTVPVQPATPAIFTSSANGSGGGAILNQDLSVNSASNPAAAGTIVAIYAGGGGQTNPQGPDGLLIPLVTPFPVPLLPAVVTIGGQTTQVSYYGEAPGLVDGVLQINAVIPAGVASGPQSVQFAVGTAVSQPNVVIYVK